MQEATAFNQPLSFDTSSVTNVGGMFWVCFALALWPPAFSRALPMHLACAAVARHLPPPSPRPAPYALRSDSWQRALALNQRLSFDTSSVDNMSYMFIVRSSPCPAPNLQSPNLQSSPACAHCVHRRCPPSAASLPAARPAPYALRSTLGSMRRRSTSR